MSEAIRQGGGGDALIRPLAGSKIVAVSGHAFSQHVLPRHHELPHITLFRLLTVDVVRRRKPIRGVPGLQRQRRFPPQLRAVRVAAGVRALPRHIDVSSFEHVNHTPGQMIVHWGRRVCGKMSDVQRDRVVTVAGELSDLHLRAPVQVAEVRALSEAGRCGQSCKGPLDLLHRGSGRSALAHRFSTIRHRFFDLGAQRSRGVCVGFVAFLGVTRGQAEASDDRDEYFIRSHPRTRARPG